MKILGTGSYLPKSIVTNDHLSEIVETTDEWIRSIHETTKKDPESL